MNAAPGSRYYYRRASRYNPFARSIRKNMWQKGDDMSLKEELASLKDNDDSDRRHEEEMASLPFVVAAEPLDVSFARRDLLFEAIELIRCDSWIRYKSTYCKDDLWPDGSGLKEPPLFNIRYKDQQLLARIRPIDSHLSDSPFFKRFIRNNELNQLANQYNSRIASILEYAVGDQSYVFLNYYQGYEERGDLVLFSDGSIYRISSRSYFNGDKEFDYIWNTERDFKTWLLECLKELS